MLRLSLFLLLAASLLFGGEILKFKEYSPKSSLNFKTTSYLMSEKLDGIRGIWNGKTLSTRNNNPLNPPKFWLKNFPSFNLDGELWLDYESFEQISSIIHTSTPNPKEWQKIIYYIFDAPNICKNCTLLERLTKLQEYLDKNPAPYIKIIPQIKIQDKNHLQSYFQSILDKKGEGIIIRQNDSSYSDSNHSYKYKPYMDSECKVIGYTQGKGKFKGMLGAIICQANLKGELKTFKIGSGFTQKERENPPPINSIITYKYNGFTKNNLPRFPIFLRIRNTDF
ncbi:DNA ligase [Helicobacter canadensis]|uniref:DNA ligase 3 n=1 Tax=Helicobacter canadensis MIT 98-5491 TaxID=537970 RepID=C5ZXL9_9HELI|nr:DNA ligase [Helicobacter canadensis]EES89887.1 DNA ligase 3 [Helicobacter canadensis MIT 98-5491]EFR48688.1 ATP-dependent DNA ligase domain protein [Helicobacter canadensis MIT 98-5491]STO99928.1 DNA ligase [Helicobacter canadensis]